MNTKSNRCVVVGLTALILSGCSGQVMRFSVLSARPTNIVANHQVVPVQGIDCDPYVLCFPLRLRVTPDLNKAVDRALVTAGSQYDALIDGTITYKWFFGFLFNVDCYEVKGKAIKTKTLEGSPGG